MARGARRRLLVVPLGVLMVALALPASGQDAADPFAGVPDWNEYGFQGEGDARVDDLDARTGSVSPSAAAREVAESLGATNPRWNAFGTPHVLINHGAEQGEQSRGGSLAGPREGAAADVARAFVRENAALFSLDPAQVDALEVLRDSPLYDSPDLARAYGAVDEPVADADVAHVVTFRQRFGDLEAGLDGLLTVGVQKDGSIVWVTSSVTGDDVVSGEQQVSAADAVKAAAADVDLAVGTLTAGPIDGGQQTFTSDKVKDVQRARLVALPTPTDGVRLAWKVFLLDTELDAHGNPTAFLTYVDAKDGTIWHRTNKLDHFAQGVPGGSMTAPASYGMAPTAALPSSRAMAPKFGAFTGSTVAGACDPEKKPFEVTEGNQTITVTVSAIGLPEISDDDVVINLYFQGALVAQQDFLTSPEVLTYAPPGGIPPGLYEVEVCPFNGAEAPPIPYTGTFAATPTDSGAVDLPTWRVFPANPPFVSGLQPADHDSPDTRVLWCWDITRFDDCAEQQRNTAARTPWDVNGASTPSFTTDGNYASTAISEASFLTPDSAANRPFSATREYDYSWGNKWFEKSCAPTFGTIAEDLNDESASTANLFTMHNRMHDWSYFLGFTEVNSNLQKTNFGNTGPEREGDPELGSSQAGRRTVNGRDNANQITPGDGIAPITNQYLWQPLAGAFYAPCVDGAYDMAVVAHEYGHAISNRMIGGGDGPLGGTGSTQGQTESWSDLIFAGYFTEFAISAGEGINPYVLGPYVTGDQEAGIRNFAMNNSPLNYSNLDYDPSGLGSPHANGEIWSATNFDILTALNVKYDALGFPSSDSALQNRCARGELPADECPGNRRWNQIQFDSFLIQPSGSTMVDSRDGMLAADMLRFGGANQTDLWSAFAKRGLGEDASAVDAGDVDSEPSFESPLRSDEARVRFTAPAGVNDMRVFAGRFEANSVPVADTVADTERGDSAAFVPGKYEFIATAPGFGSQRFTMELARGQRTVEAPFRRNHASAASGATITGDGVNLDKLIDDTELTNWASLQSQGTASEGNGEGQQVEGREVVVDLAGDAAVDVREVQVSAALRPLAPAPEDDEELPTDPDPGAQSRFSALRSFDLFSCDATAGADCSKAESFTQIFESPEDAFPSTRPRPRVPDHIVRPFDVTDVKATHLKLVVRDNQCTGGPDFQGETNPDADPAFNPDCDTTAASPDRAVLRTLAAVRQQVRAAELQVFSTPSAPVDNVVKAVARDIGPACPDNEVPRNSRDDISGNTHERAIDCMIWYEIAKGTSDTKYDPFTAVSRAQMASFVARLIERGGPQLPEGDPNRFSDVRGNTHEDNINKLAQAGVIDGKGDGRYDPDGTVTRAQMAKFLVQGYQFRAQRQLPAPTVDYFPDDNGNTHEVNINKAAAAGFTVGRTNGDYDPEDSVLRDQMASFLARTLTLLVEDGVTARKSA